MIYKLNSETVSSLVEKPNISKFKFAPKVLDKERYKYLQKLFSRNKWRFGIIVVRQTRRNFFISLIRPRNIKVKIRHFNYLSFFSPRRHRVKFRKIITRPINNIVSESQSTPQKNIERAAKLRNFIFIGKNNVKNKIVASRRLQKRLIKRLRKLKYLRRITKTANLKFIKPTKPESSLTRKTTFWSTKPSFYRPIALSTEITKKKKKKHKPQKVHKFFYYENKKRIKRTFLKEKKENLRPINCIRGTLHVKSYITVYKFSAGEHGLKGKLKGGFNARSRTIKMLLEKMAEGNYKAFNLRIQTQKNIKVLYRELKALLKHKKIKCLNVSVVYRKRHGFVRARKLKRL